MTDKYDLLEAASSDADFWPQNLIRSKFFRHDLVFFQTQLHQESYRLFDQNPEYASVDFWEAFHGQQFQSGKCTSLPALKHHLQFNRKDPMCRHIFFSAEHSQAPLDCSKSMFAFVMTWHQVMAPFAEFLFSFGKPRSSTNGFHYTSFQHESWLGTDQAQKLAIPRFGRSGEEIRHCFNLWSPERSDSPGEPAKWSLRQTASYHAFDVVSGQSLWVTIKANEVIKSRIADATVSCDGLRAESLSGLCGSFAAALTTHLIYFEWAGENWRRYNNSLEEAMREILDKVNNAPVEKVESLLAYDAKVLIKPLQNPNEMSPAPNTERTFSWPSIHNSSGAVGQVKKTDTGFTTTTIHSMGQSSKPLTVSIPLSPLLGRAPMPPTAGQGMHNDQDQDPFEVLRDFSIEKLQRLNGIGTHLRTSCSVMKLNVEVLHDVLHNYEELWELLPDEIRDECKPAFADFSRRTKSIIRELEKEQARITALMQLLQDGRELFDKFLQLRHIEQSKLFTANAHQSAQHMQNLTVEMHTSTKNMEIIAAKTEKETASMHIITLVTLVFLPGTFVAVRLGLPLLPLVYELLTSGQTLFGSGLFQWDQNNPETNVPIWKDELWKIFASVSFPLMGVTILVWLLFAYGIPLWKMRRRQQATPDEEEGLGGRKEGIYTK